MFITINRKDIEEKNSCKVFFMERVLYNFRVSRIK